MSTAFIELILFTTKTLIIGILILIILIMFLAVITKGRQKTKGKLLVKNLNKKYSEATEAILEETLSKKDYKKHLKEKKVSEKAKLHSHVPPKNIYVINFHGDLKASAVEPLREEIDAILNVATSADEVVLRLESAGGVVHGYGLATSQLQRLRSHSIPLTVTIDKVAASGGYLMACVADKILAAPFSIIGSIGVIVQLPNFNRLLKDNHIDFEQHTAGEFKRTITLFGENTKEAREKLQQEIEDVHQLFKKVILTYRPTVDIKKVATGEYWLGQQAIDLKLIDELKTSDDYLLTRSKEANLYEICYEVKKTFLNKVTSSVNSRENLIF